MDAIKVCVGSSCYIKGAYDVINEFKKIIEENSLENEVELKACFCQGRCMDAPCVEAGDNFKVKVTPAQAENIIRSMGINI